MKKISTAIALFVLPVIVSAAATPDVGYLTSILTSIKSLINTALPIIIAAAVVWFVYGIARYVMAGDDGAKEAAKDKIIYGIIGLVVMVSVWGLVNIVINVLGLNDDTAIPTTVNNLIPNQGNN